MILQIDHLYSFVIVDGVTVCSQPALCPNDLAAFFGLRVSIEGCLFR